MDCRAQAILARSSSVKLETAKYTFMASGDCTRWWRRGCRPILVRWGLDFGERDWAQGKWVMIQERQVQAQKVAKRVAGGEAGKKKIEAADWSTEERRGSVFGERTSGNCRRFWMGRRAGCFALACSVTKELFSASDRESLFRCSKILIQLS